MLKMKILSINNESDIGIDIKNTVQFRVNITHCMLEIRLTG